MTARLIETLFPDPPRRIPYERPINIGFRTAHILTAGIILGGHAFDVEPHRLLPWLYLTVASGLALIGLEVYRSCRWVYLGKGVLVIAKLGLLLLTAAWWDARVPLLFGVVVLGSVGSHMSASWRYYSVLHNRVLWQQDDDAPPRRGRP